MEMRQGYGVSVLLVDDEPDQIDMYRLGLEAAGFTILAAESGERALAVARAEKPDVIVLDLRLPGMSGWEVCAALKADSLTTNIPIVILTAAASPTLAQEAERAGCAAHLLKPCYPSDLAATVDRVLTGARPSFGV